MELIAPRRLRPLVRGPFQLKLQIFREKPTVVLKETTKRTESVSLNLFHVEGLKDCSREKCWGESCASKVVN